MEVACGVFLGADLFVFCPAVLVEKAGHLIRHQPPVPDAVFDDELQPFLEKLGVWGKFQRGELRCKFCQTTITFENLHSMFPQSGDIKFVCERAECTRMLAELLNDGTVKI